MWFVYLTCSSNGGMFFLHIMPWIAATTSSIAPEPSSRVRRQSFDSPVLSGTTRNVANSWTWWALAEKQSTLRGLKASIHLDFEFVGLDIVKWDVLPLLSEFLLSASTQIHGVYILVSGGCWVFLRINEIRFELNETCKQVSMWSSHMYANAVLGCVKGLRVLCRHKRSDVSVS